MTKEQFKNYKDKTAYCECCKREMPVKNFMYSYMRLNGTASQCRYCGWINRHNGLPKIDGYDEYQIKTTIEFLLFEESIYINDLADKLGIKLEDTIALVQHLKIGNKLCLVKSQCVYCGKDIKNHISTYNKTKHLYCSLECYWKHKPEVVGHGKDNWQYNRIKTNCNCCGKEIEVIPYSYNLKNSHGDNHNFCSQKCYWKFRSKYYVGDKSVNANVEFTPERLEKMRQVILKNSRSSKRFDSKIQLIVNSILDKNKIKYEREHIIKFYAIDNYLKDSGLMIEVMGDYWHTSPLKYNKDRYLINEMQQKGLQHDKQKHTYIKNHNKIEILYLWEYDIENNIDMCEQLIQKYIKQKGILENYHSFNWQLVNGNLILKDSLIKPYQDMKTDEYRHILKKKVG